MSCALLVTKGSWLAEKLLKDKKVSICLYIFALRLVGINEDASLKLSYGAVKHIATVPHCNSEITVQYNWQKVTRKQFKGTNHLQMSFRDAICSFWLSKEYFTTPH